MKKVLKYSAIIFGVLIVLLFATCSIMSKKMPEGVKSDKTEMMVDKMWNALNKDAWDTTKYVRWDFRGAHEYIWDKEANLAQISWKKNRVLLNPNQVDGVAYQDGAKVTGDEARKLIDKAWGFWCNDMFWLVAPYKVKDAGTSLSLVSDEEKGDRLKVTYTGGGVTPGDTYVWELNEDGTPKAYEMYVGVLPLKGINVPWNDWVTITTGAKIASGHSVGLKLGGIKGGNTLADVDLNEDIWKEIR